MHDTSQGMQHEFKDRDEMWFVSAWMKVARLSSDHIFMKSISCTVRTFLFFLHDKKNKKTV